MPGNIISLNNYYEWYVGDSNMPRFMKLLAQIGIKDKLKKPKKQKKGKKYG